MNDPRRVARELALRTLYQIEVGSTPLEEALVGAHEQLRISVVQPMDQMRLEAKSDLKQTALVLAGELPALASRRVKGIATSAGKTLDRLVGRAMEVCHAICGSPDSRHGDPTEALNPDIFDTRKAIEKLMPKDPLASDAADRILDLTLEHLDKIATMYRRKVPLMAEQALLLNGLVAGSQKHREEADEILTKRAEGWAQERRPVVDQAILRMAVYELIHVPASATAIILNEAVELAKKYSTENSPKYVNGVLDRIAQEVREPTKG